ncbi:FliC/FljB family flagellin [Pectobacterium parmentieri]|uniref:Flagellin n=2 Tax=Pectobacterium parmentieri TaxID=1905730 RepID=A0ABS0RVL0_PECPM|nr:FliC/FljB family flagellin [Pectobacterium parmentieri]ACX87677.1 flagellin domain protein [Pectobacterium parmentieri WPP163]MBI0469308.1 FliC/FljB family flagellin [Pectobacterium parmentieri]MBI0491932.1 FliC/FljB family flagellin [Pectobacterium parmentieri]MBI0553216.1 FliC/FljB family flagellin [Pectobacterium parmentieri]MBI0566387.1 FliC/FljB family flagellin [Pectobacterium parmentieri]
MAVINTNSLSLTAQNNLNKSQSALGTAIERLSSGFRINSAKDDAAGQAIANRFTANIKGLTQAARNANDGISVAQTTEGALNEINNNLQRIRELTVQAANGSNQDVDLDSVQGEIQQRLDEIDRVSSQTQFNGVKVLASDQGLKIQVGANDNETITINLQEITSSTLGLGGFSVSASTPKLSDSVTQLGDGTGAPTAPNFTDALASLNTGLGLTGDKALTAKDVTLHNVLDANGAGTAQYALKVGNDVYAAKVTAGAVDVVKSTTTVTDNTLGGGATTVTLNDALVKLGGDGTTGYVSYQGKNYQSADLAGGATTVAVGGAAPTATYAAAKTVDPLKALDAALSKVDSLRSDLGAIQNRFESTVTNLNNTVNNLTSARSRIQDADIATEVSNMSKNQILQQAGTSVLAQANQVPQTVLSLLR